MRTRTRHWAAFRLGHMGDAVLATGALEHWRATLGLDFAVITRTPFAPLFEGHPAVSEIAAVEAASLASLGAWVREARSLASRYRGWGLVDLHGTPRSAILAAFWKGPVRRYPKMSVHRRLFALFNLRCSREKLLRLNVPQRYALALDAAAPLAADLEPLIVVTDQERDAARKRLESLGVTGPFVALHPYATHVNKAWPKSRWDELATALRAMNRDFIVIGQSDDPIFPKSPHDLTGQTSLRETCALLAEASALVTGDSGPMHLAVGVGAPVIALFGPTDRAWGFYPEEPKNRILERKMDCRPCSLHGGDACQRGLACLAEITASDVLNTLEELLKSSNKQAGKERA